MHDLYQPRVVLIAPGEWAILWSAPSGEERKGLLRLVEERWLSLDDEAGDR